MPKKFRVCLWPKFPESVPNCQPMPKIPLQLPNIPEPCRKYIECFSPIMPKCSADMFRTVLPGGVMGVVKLPNIAVICQKCVFAHHAKK